MKTVQQVLYAAWGKDKIQFTSAYPKTSDSKDITPPIITYSILNKTPGAVGSKNTSEIKPRHREFIKIEDEKGNTTNVELFGQLFDYTILFELWAEDGEEADELSERFQYFMSQYIGYFKKAGVSEIVFENMDGTVGNPQWRTDLISRNVIYRVRLDEVTGIRCPSIEDVTVDAILHKTSFDMLLDILTRDDDQ